MLTLKIISKENKDLITTILTKSFNYDTQLYFGKNAEDGPPGYNDGYLSDKLLNDNKSRSFLIYEKTETIAFISINIYEREVNYFCVLPKYIGQGYGQRIWKIIEEMYGDSDWALETPHYSISNHHFYEKIGFIKTGEKAYDKDVISFIFNKKSHAQLNHQTVSKLIENSPDFMKLLKIVEQLHLKDSWIAAGTLRNFLWNCLIGNVSLDQKTDIDVVFYDNHLINEETLVIQNSVQEKYPEYKWELKNQVYMHHCNPNTPKYLDTRDAISKYPEKCTAIGVRLIENRISLFSPFGFNDIENFLVRPTEHFLTDKKRIEVYNKRVTTKKWIEKYPDLRIQLVP